jgi:hypothetical protein
MLNETAHFGMLALHLLGEFKQQLTGSTLIPANLLENGTEPFSLRRVDHLDEGNSPLQVRTKCGMTFSILSIRT